MKVARRRSIAIGMVIAATTLVSCEGGEDTTARRRRAATEVGSPVTTLPASTTTTQAGELTSRVAYVWDRDIWVADTASGENVRVTADRHFGAETAVRMHGADHVTYASTVEVAREPIDLVSTIWDVDLESGVRTPLYRTDGSIMDFDWAPDGGSLAILETNWSGEHVVRVGKPQLDITPIYTLAAPAPVDSSGRSVSLAGLLYADVTFTRRSYDQRVEWSPDGERLLFVDPVLKYWPGSHPSLFVIDPSGALIASRIADGAAWVTTSSVVVSTRELNTPLELFDVVHKTSTRLLTRGGVRSPTVSPDHLHIAYDDGGVVPSSYIYSIERGQEQRLGDGIAPQWLDPDRLLIGSVTPECPPTPSTRCGLLGETAHSSIIQVATRESSGAAVASTLVASAWTGRTPSHLMLGAASVPALVRTGLTIEAQIGYAGVGPLAIGIPVDAIESQTGSRLIQQTCSYALFPPLASGLTPRDIYFYIDYRTRQVTGITILNPTMSTISGVHVGSTEADVMRTYGNVERKATGAHGSELIITNPEGRQVRFFMSGGVVTQMLIAASEQSIIDQSLC